MADETVPDAEARKPPIPRVKIFFDPAEYKKDVRINPTDLSSAMADQASLFTHYGELLTQAMYELDKWKDIEAIRVAKADRTIRDRAAADGSKLTEASIEKEISRHPEVVALRLTINKAKHQVELGKVVVESFKQRRDMLVQLGASDRENLKGEQRILAVEANERAQAARRERALEMTKPRD